MQYCVQYKQKASTSSKSINFPCIYSGDKLHYYWQKWTFTGVARSPHFQTTYNKESFHNILAKTSVTFQDFESSEMESFVC